MKKALKKIDNYFVSSEIIISRIKEHIQDKNKHIIFDCDVADILGIDRNGLPNMKRRNTKGILLLAIKYANDNKIDIMKLIGA